MSATPTPESRNGVHGAHKQNDSSTLQGPYHQAQKLLHLSVESSLNQLLADHIDSLYDHFWDMVTTVEEPMQGSNNLAQARSPVPGCLRCASLVGCPMQHVRQTWPSIICCVPRPMECDNERYGEGDCTHVTGSGCGNCCLGRS